jgi:hypothetical protein
MKSISGIRIGLSAPDLIIALVSSIDEVEKIFFRRLRQIKNLKELKQGNEFSRFSVEQLLRHQPRKMFPGFWLSRNNIVNDSGLSAIKLEDEETLAVTSRVLCQNGKIRHLPLVDFNCEINSDNLQTIKDFFKQTIGQGIILESGRSYHGYGTKLLSQREMAIFFGNCLLFSGFIDERYIGHRLIDGEMCLRITANRLRSELPKVVDWV